MKRLSRALAEKIAALEVVVQKDLGGRGISAFTPPPGELARAASSLFRLRQSDSTLAILTGFPCCLDFSPPTETDGPLGAVSIARSFLATTSYNRAPSPSVVLVTDECNGEVLRAAVRAAGLDANPLLAVETYGPRSSWTAADAARFDALDRRASTVVAIERAGPGKDGGYYTMRGFDMAHLVAPLEELMKAREGRETVGIGDGGNEVGMGKMYTEILASTVPHAPKVACVTPCDSLLVCGVSNWGGAALAAALVALRSAEAGAEAGVEAGTETAAGGASAGDQLWAAAMPSEADDIATLGAMVEAGARDGCSKELAATVDGMPFEVSLAVSRELRAICLAP